MDKSMYLRQWRIVDTDKIPPIGIIGAGSIGSWVTLTLAKLGAQDITVWDFDKVEKHNGPNQIYRPHDIGKSKVKCLADIIEEFTGTKIKAVNKKYDGTAKPIIICGVDSIKIRKQIFKKFIDMNIKIKRYWDCRMGGEMTTILSLNPMDPDDVEAYEKTFFKESEAAELPCGEQSVGYNNGYIASFMANQVKCYAMKQDYFKSMDFSWKTHSFSGMTVKGDFMQTIVKGGKKK
jgi:hypothetical protein